MQNVLCFCGALWQRYTITAQLSTTRFGYLHNIAQRRFLQSSTDYIIVNFHLLPTISLNILAIRSEKLVLTIDAWCGGVAELTKPVCLGSNKKYRTEQTFFACKYFIYCLGFFKVVLKCKPAARIIKWEKIEIGTILTRKLYFFNQ